MIARFFAPLGIKIFAGLSALLLVALAVQTIRANHYRDSRDNYKLAAETLKKSYIAAQAAAVAEQKALYASISARQRDKARFADESNRIAQDRARSAVAGYAERMRLDRVCRGSSLDPSAPRPAPDRDGPGGAAEYVAVTRNDFEIMVANSVRLEEVRKWGEALIRDGLAEPLPDPAFGQ